MSEPQVTVASPKRQAFLTLDNVIKQLQLKRAEHDLLKAALDLLMEDEKEPENG